MSPEEMGKVSRRARLTFAVASVAFVGVLAVSPFKDYLRAWKGYEKDYRRLAASRPDTKRLLADYHSGIDQIWLPDIKVVDRCTTCHQGIAEPSLLDASVPQPFRAHPVIPHDSKQWGCTVCHRGQGPATEVAEAHETTVAWEQPLLPAGYIQASCGSCHRNDIPQAPQLNRGRQLLADLNCATCHKLQGIERAAMPGPDLTNIGTKVSWQWIYKWLKEPHTVVDSSGNAVVNGYETEDVPRMPQFRLSDQEIAALSAYLASRSKQPIEPYKYDPKVLAAWEKRPDVVELGEVRFRQMFCTTCHSLQVTRGEETKLIGGDIGPELTKVGSKVKPDWLVSWLRNPQGYLAHATMPRYQWSDEDLYKVTQYITTKLTDPDLLTSVPDLGPASEEDIAKGQRLFTDKGCASCHLIQDINPQRDFGPDLSALGAKNASQLEFGSSKIPRNILSYIQAKISDPLSVNPAARMPQYHLKPADLDAITTALLAMKGTASGGAWEKFVVHKTDRQFDPAGAFGELYERYRCDACHAFNGWGGNLAPDLSFEGSRANRQWIIDFLKNPQTLRPMLLFRMPQFNITDKEAAIIADYLITACQSRDVKPPGPGQNSGTAELATVGKELYEVKYTCQACHTIGSSGGYVGPNLSNAGNWLTASWIRQWLRNPQSLVPGAIEPHRTFTDQEIDALTAYLLTLKQSGAAQPKAGDGVAAAGGMQ